MSGRRALSIAERACLLRAARADMRRMELELDRLYRLPGKGADKAASVLQMQYECLSSAIRWIWQQGER